MGIVKENYGGELWVTHFFDLSSRLEDIFSEIERDIIIDLQENREEYANLHSKVSKFKQQHPFIDKERLQIYFRGHTDAFAYLKRINAI